MIRQISLYGLEMIKAFEGFRASAYKCPAGVDTQGYGHTKSAGGEVLGGIWTKEKATQILNDDLNRNYIPGVLNITKDIDLTQGQFDALVSFAYNCGVKALKGSSIIRHLKNKDMDQAAAAFLLWVKSRGKTMPGLVRRRNSEMLAFQGFQDINFDGKHTSDEPVYGVMPQSVDVAREKIASSGELQGAGTAAVGGALVVINELQASLKEAETHIADGSKLGMIIGGIIIVGALYAAYLKWHDMGRPNPFYKLI